MKQRRNFMRFFEAKDYGQRDAGNPLFPKKEPGRPWALLIGLTSLVAVVVAGLGYLIYGPIFRIGDVVVSGQVSLAPEQISELVEQQLSGRVALILPRNQAWFFSKRAAEQKLTQALPLESAIVSVDGHTLNVQVQERVFLVVFVSGPKTYVLDADGHIAREATADEASVVQARLAGNPGTPDAAPPVIADGTPIVIETAAHDHVVGDPVLDATEVKNILAFSQAVTGLGITPTSYGSDDLSQPWFTLKSNRPYGILFDAEKSESEQATVLKAVLDDYAGKDADIDRIDVRFGNRVFLR